MDSMRELWEEHPNPILIDREALIEVVERCLHVLGKRRRDLPDLDAFADWYSMVPEAVRDDAALDRPADMMIAEVITHPKRDAYLKTVRRDAEFNHFLRLARSQDREVQRLTATNKRLEEKLQNLLGDMPMEVMAACKLQASCKTCPVGAAAIEKSMDCRQYVEQAEDYAEYLASEWRLRHNE